MAVDYGASKSTSALEEQLRLPTDPEIQVYKEIYFDHDTQENTNDLAEADHDIWEQFF